MPYVRRKPYATSFAWPPTREDLDLIEVVDADTLCPIHARCDEPEPPPPAPPVLLKSVTPVRPIVRAESAPDLPALPLPPSPQPLVVVPPVPTLPRASWTWLSTHFDSTWLIATGAVLAVSLSAYLSLRAAPAVSASDLDPVSSIPSRPAPHLTASAIIPFDAGWAMPMAAPASQPPTMTPAPPKPSARVTSPRGARLQPTPKPAARLTAAARPPQPPPVAPRPATLQPQRSAPPTVSSLALNTRRSPFLSNVIESMPSAPAAAVPTVRLAVDTHRAAGTPTSPAVSASSGSTQASQAQVRAALREYERAYEQLDAKAVRAVWPSVDTRALERAFHDLKSQRLVFERCDIDVARGSQAVAACRGRATYETRAGQQSARSEPREWTFTLQKSDEAWRIVSASAR